MALLEGQRLINKSWKHCRVPSPPHVTVLALD